MRELRDGSMAVGLFNGNSKARNITCDIAAVWKGYSGLAAHTSTSGSSAVIRNVWQRRDLGVFNGTFTAQDVGVHDTVVLKFTRT